MSDNVRKNSLVWWNVDCLLIKNYSLGKFKQLASARVNFKLHSVIPQLIRTGKVLISILWFEYNSIISLKRLFFFCAFHPVCYQLKAKQTIELLNNKVKISYDERNLQPSVLLITSYASVCCWFVFIFQPFVLIPFYSSPTILSVMTHLMHEWSKRRCLTHKTT